MKQRTAWLAVLLFLTCTAGFGQKSPVKFGDIPMEDMSMTVYDKDSSAVAVILVDYGEAYVNIGNSAELVYERHFRVKILKNEGLKWADAGILLYTNGTEEERVTGLKAFTYNLVNGSMVKTELSKSGVFKERYNRNYNIQKFTFPNVKVGSVLEYSYTVRSGFLSNFPNWQFQYEIPSRLSEYWAIIPDFFVMEKYMQGYLAATTFESKSKPNSGYSDNAMHWVMKDVPAFKVEPYMTSEDDYVSKINFALAYVNFPGSPSREIMGTWEKLNQDLLANESFGGIISGSGYLGKKTDEIIAGVTDPKEKIQRIYDYVKNTLEWDGVHDFYAYPPKEIFEKKKGSSGDINLALASLLEKAGFIVDMVLLSTRDHGFVREQYPMRKQFNYAVCLVRIDGVPVLLDATERYLPMGVLPDRCLNGKGLIISKNFHGWIALESKTKAKTTTSIDLTLGADASLQGTYSVTRDGYDAASTRKRIVKSGQEQYVKSLTASHPNWTLDGSTFTALEEVGSPLKEIHKVSILDHATSAGDVIYLNPFIHGQLEKNPFTLDNRLYPVDFGVLQEKTYLAKFVVPDGYVVDEVPASKLFSLPGNGARFTYSVTVNGNVVSVVCSLLVNKTIYVQTEYAYLREFYNQIVAKEAEQIVIKKK
jgi:hypothetical protein